MAIADFSAIYLPGLTFELGHLSEFLDDLGGKMLGGDTMLPVKYGMWVFKLESRKIKDVTVFVSWVYKVMPILLP